jgi:hypothetical protein
MENERIRIFSLRGELLFYYWDFTRLRQLQCFVCLSRSRRPSVVNWLENPARSPMLYL